MNNHKKSIARALYQLITFIVYCHKMCELALKMYKKYFKNKNLVHFEVNEKCKKKQKLKVKI